MATTVTTQRLSRWGTTSRRKSDSVLGKPQRRTSIEETLEVCQNARMLIEELTEEGEEEGSSEFLTMTTAERTGTTPTSTTMSMRMREYEYWETERQPHTSL
jgi:hypothetical protein